MSVNDLAEKWRDEDGPQFVPDTRENVIERVQDAFSDCASDLEEVARTAWHPVSEPPTEADGDAFGLVVIRFPACEGDPSGTFMWPWDRLANEADPLDANDQKVEWARVADVVLMPPQGGE